MRIVFIGCVQFSFITLKRVLELPDSIVVGVLTKRQSAFNADFVSLSGIAKQYEIPCCFSEEMSQEEICSWIKGKSPDVIYCFGWSHLLKPEVLSLPPMGVIGFHPASLPQNRGRHPIIWTLALGLKQTASTFFFMDEGADSGDILSQVGIEVLTTDDAQTLYNKIIQCALDQITQFTPSLASKNYKTISQDHSQANYWRKRSKRDGCVDWRMSASTVFNLVRALSHPYVGAHFTLSDGNEIKLWKAEIVSGNANHINIEPGKILAVEKNNIFVKCGEGIIKIVEHDMKVLPEVGDYL